MSRTSALFRLQEIDSELDARRSRLDAIEAALGESPAVREAQRLVVEATNQRDTSRVSVRTLEHENQRLNDKIAEVEQRLYSGAVTNAKELQDLHKDLDMLKRQRAAAEERQLEALIAYETAEGELTALSTSLGETEAETARAHHQLLAERDELQVRCARLEDEREAASGSVPADDRETYERLRASKHGRAVTRLAEGVCAACGVAPSSSRLQDARQGNELIRCGNCGRILYAD